MSWWNPVDWVKGAVKGVGTVASAVGGVASTVGGVIPGIGGTVKTVGGWVASAGGALAGIGGVAKAVGSSVTIPPQTNYPQEVEPVVTDKRCFIANEVYPSGCVPVNFYILRNKLPKGLVRTYYKSSPFLINIVRTFHAHKPVKWLLDRFNSIL